MASSILIVGNDPEGTIPDLQEPEGCSIVVVKTEQEALTQVNQRLYDLVLLDRNQPDKEALSLLSSLKQSNPHCPIVILSSMLELKNKSEFLNRGAFDFLRKPYTADEFKDTLRRALEYKAARKITLSTISGLIANGERYRAIVQAAQDGIILGDQDGSILSWNEAAQNMFGYTAEEVVGKPLTLLMPHRYRQAHQQGLKRIQSTGERRLVGRNIELHGLKKGGEEFPIELSLSRSVETEEVFYCGIIRDISERKRLAAQLLEETKLAEVGRVVGDIGHDMKNILMPVLNGAQLAEEELEEHFAKVTGLPMKEVEASRNFIKECLVMIVNNARRIQDRVREIADTVKGITSPLRLAPCQVAEVVESVFASLRLYATDKGVSLRAQDLDSLPLIHADTNRLFNALYNLINNAIPETPVGGSVTVVGSLGPEAKTVVIRVADTGGGMPPEIRDRLFTKGAISGKPGGTGLGTRIVKDVVDAHGGTITVDSEQGKGTTFTMELPIHCQLG